MSPTDRADALRIGAGQTVPGHVHGTEDVVADHGLLIPASLLDDDHPQYLPLSGSRPMTGNLAMGSKKVTGIANATADTDAVAYGQIKGLLANTIGAGAGLTGGGAITGNPTLNVGAGSQIEVSADAVGLYPWCTQITDWNQGYYNGWFMGSNAANNPGPGWWYGFTIAHNAVPWARQIAFPFANGSFPEKYWAMRECYSGTWQPWYRAMTYISSVDVQDNFLMIQHGPTEVRRWAIGGYKDKNTAAASASDQFRIQRYDTAGTYTGNLMTGTTAGVVNFPGGHTLMMQAMAGGTEVNADRAATVGIVEEMIRIALDNAGVLPPQAREANAAPLTGMRIGEPSPDYDPSSEEPAPMMPRPQIDETSLG